MSKPLDDQTLLPLTSCAAASPAKTSLSPASAPASAPLAPVSGLSTSESSGSYPPPLVIVENVRASLTPDIACTAESLPRQTSARHTSEKDSSLWRTPLAADAHKGVSENRKGRPDADGLRRWPTPVATDAASAARGSTTTGVMHPGMSLTDAIRMWPTPTASDYGTSNNGCPGDGREEFATKGKPSLSTMARTEGGILNPDWVETLMGFPIGWTDGPLDPETLPLFGNLRDP